jgi:hypothetical protein
MMVEAKIWLILHEMIDAETYDDTSNEELDVSNEQLCRGSLHSVNVYLPILIDVVGPVESTNIRKYVLEE